MDDEFPMHRAAEGIEPYRLRLFIEGGWSVDSRDNRGRTPLHLAAKCGRYENAQLLIRSKCDLDLEDSKGRTAVLLAATCGEKAVVDLLLRHGARTSCLNDREWTLLQWACYQGWIDLVHDIVQGGDADLNAERGSQSTPLKLAAGQGHEDVVALLIRAGADVNQKGAMKWTVLHNVAYSGPVCSRALRVLLETEGVDINAQDEEGETPLHEACKQEHPEMVRQLLEAGADPNVENCIGENVLGEGIRQACLTLEGIRLLVEHGAFLQDCAYEVIISLDPHLKESVLKDVALCTQSIVNKFHCQSLPALSSISYFARKLPNVNKFKLNAGQISEVEDLVKAEIERNGFCNVVKVFPMALSALCVLSLITSQAGTKRSASPDFGDSNSPFKKLHT